MIASSDTSVEALAAPPADRVRLAASLDCTLAALRELAHDPDVMVRATVALNSRSDAELDAIIASDVDERVRALFARRLAQSLSSSTVAPADATADRVVQTLRTLAVDRAVCVRAAVADELATTSAAPHDLIVDLAHDISREVNDPVIRLSPLLSDDDLLRILSSANSFEVGSSIAGREKLSAVVADAIVERADAPTIRALLVNRSARIREATLDALIGRAPNHIEWHAPLVCRSNLSGQAVRTLCEFITSDLLRVLASRTDLDPEQLQAVKYRYLSQTMSDGASAVEVARRLQADGRLTEAALLESAYEGDERQLLARLSVSSGIELERIQHVLDLRSAKALTSLVWCSGFSMQLATVIQNVVSQIDPDKFITPTADGGFPLSDSEMTWQIELLKGI